MRKIRRIIFIILCFCLLSSSVTDWIPCAYATSEMTTSASCIEFIKEVEGFSSKPYYDYSQYTVGYGTKCPDEKYDEYVANSISKAEAEELLQKELTEIEDTLNQNFIDKYNLTFTQNQFDALVSFSYNIGTGWITYDSSLRNAILNNAAENDMVYAFSLYCTAGGKYLSGLITRRLCEANMYLNGVYSQTRNDDFGYVYYDANGGTVKYRVQGFLCDDNSVPAANALRSNDVFLGWYTELTGGSQVAELTKALTGKTLFAHWQSSENTEDQNVTATTVRVTGDVVNIRSGPGTNYGIVKRSYQNEILTVSHITHLTNMRWGKVSDGWICLDYTNYDAVISGTDNSADENIETPSDEVTTPEDDSAWNDADTEIDTSPDDQSIVSGVVNVNDFLNIRSGPGTTYGTVGFLFRGTKVSILTQTTVGSTVWGQIEKGWVCMDYIVTDRLSNDGTTQPDSVQNPVDNKSEAVTIKGTITADALRIRSGAGTTYPIVGFYYQNDPVVVSEKVLVDTDYWGKTNKGWISMNYIFTDSSSAESSQNTGEKQKTVIADCLRIRKEAGTENKIVGFLYFGDKISVLETKDINGTVWGRVNTGWICMQFVN